ncbi:FRG domain-containing protein [Chitinophaga sp. YR627]|uniref:FRG domain-containing protein n=1 Tax=Chitinophaga sp. YR627 TaxID=1881041 RepID=UPI0008DF8388|nr:FRG domain-containing protein [Chitinophaga sp. YR627]SFO75873.1 FRG domain-containing protein [Chitinophaga sp. YR627]
MAAIKKAVPKKRLVAMKRPIRGKKPALQYTSKERQEHGSDLEINCLETFVRYIEANTNLEYVLYRGQKEDWPLVPKLSRVKIRSGNELAAERMMLENFKRLARPHLSKIPGNDWEWLALAQHHGMATRLLDWTSNPLAALWFAIAQPSTSKYGVVHVLFADEKAFLKPTEIHKLDPFKETKPKIFQPEISTIRIQSQSGWFTTQKLNKRTNNFEPFNKSSSFSRDMQRLIIPSECFSDLRYQLDKFGVNRFSLFQDLDGIAAYAEWSHTQFTDEGEPDANLTKGKKL